MTTISDTRRDLEERKARTTVLRMRARGLILQVMHTRARQAWWLSDGTHIANGVARRVVADPCIVPQDDSLFPAGPAQTYRHVSSEGH